MNTTLLNSTTGLKSSLPYTSIPLFILFIYSICLGFPLNAYIIIHLFSRCRELNTLPNLNQAIANIMFMAVVPFQFVCTIKLKWCFLYPMGFLLTWSMSARIIFQCWVCVERYLAVIHPVTFLRYKPLRYRLGCSVLLWTAALALGIIGMLTFPFLPYKVFIPFYLVILTVELFCGMSILKGLRRPGPRDMGKEEGDISAAKKKAFRKVAINLLTFLIQNIPIVIIFGLQNHLSLYAFYVAMINNFALTTATSTLQSVSVLHQAGKLSFLKYICLHTCCSGATMSTQQDE